MLLTSPWRVWNVRVYLASDISFRFTGQRATREEPGIVVYINRLVVYLKFDSCCHLYCAVYVTCQTGLLKLDSRSGHPVHRATRLVKGHP